MKTEENKRLFFAVELFAPWPQKLPLGRMLDEKHRHMTLAFLGNVPYQRLLDRLSHFPIQEMRVGMTGHFDYCVFLPEKHPNVVAWHAAFYEGDVGLINFQRTLSGWLRQNGYDAEKKEWMAHATLCRKPFDSTSWKKNFVTIPFSTGNLHLYESVGNLVYTPIWSYPIQVPFEELDHTADIAFQIYGESLQQIYYNAFGALAFKYRALLDFFIVLSGLETIDDVVIILNEIIAHADGEVGCPFKAVSFHGEVVAFKNGILKWEMIVDV